MFLPAKLKQLRIARGKSLQQLADDIGSSKAHLWDLETGRSTNPSLELLIKLSRALKVSVADLVGENPTGEEEDTQAVAMFRDLKELTPEERDAIQGIIDRFKNRNKPK